MGIRYNNSTTILNDEEIYEEFREERHTKKIRHHATPEMPYLSVSHRLSLSRFPHTWKVGDRYWKLASKYYKNPSLWWLIAWYNEKPTDAHYDLGDIVYVPLPLGRIMSYWNIAP